MTAIRCPFCKALSNFTTVYESQLPPTAVLHDRITGGFVLALRCSNEECTVVIGAVSRNGELVHWPKDIPSPAVHDVPDHIARAAEEAYLDLDHECYRSAAILARAVVEATAKEKGITTGGVYQKIEALHSHGFIREVIKDAAHEIRQFANEMAHGDFVDPVAPEEAAEIVGLMGEVLEEVFQMPERLARLKSARLAKQVGGSAP